MTNPYEHTDKIIAMIDRVIVKEFGKFKSQMVSGFDELNFFKETDKLYKKVDKKVKKYFLTLATSLYKKYGGDIDEIDELHELLLSFYDEVDKTTRYIYNKEVERKRDRLAESLYSCTSKAEVPKEVTTAMKYMSRMVTQYADDITLAIFILVLQQKGIKHVKWITENDNRVCNFCVPLHNKVYPIDKIPDRQHWGCRCWIEPVD